jgi:hypothetical protein
MAQLRAYCYLDRLQPRYAAFLGTVAEGDLPVQGMAAVFVEVAPGNEVFRLVDAAVKASPARPGAQVVEREFGLVEFHAPSPADVQAAGAAMLAALGLRSSDRRLPMLVSVQLITRVDAYQAQLLNRFRRGALLEPGETLLVVECEPAAYANWLANEAEKYADVRLIHASGLGRFGRLWLAGSEAETLAARAAIERAVESAREPEP